MSYLKQIEQLISLQKVDDEIHAVQCELENAPKELEAFRVQFAEIEAKRNRLLEKLEHLREQEKRLGVEIEDDVMRLKRSKGKLMQVENSKEYHAMMREMDSLEKVNRGREEEKSLLVEESASQQLALEEVEEEYNQAQTALAACEAGLQERLDKAKVIYDALMGQRNEAATAVPMPIFSRYEFIRERLSHPVIVPVSEGVCSGCHIAIPPQNYVELQKGKQILSCPNCQRLIFWESHFSH